MSSVGPVFYLAAVLDVPHVALFCCSGVGEEWARCVVLIRCFGCRVMLSVGSVSFPTLEEGAAKGVHSLPSV